MIKICSKCKKELSKISFYKDERSLDGLKSQCRQCHNKYAIRYYKKRKKPYNPEKAKINREKYRANPKHRLDHEMSKIIGQALKGKKNGWHWENLIGYTSKDLMSHLEEQFTPEMTWENYGSWHIDHIIPQSWFEYKTTKDPEFKKCWALDNLQPLEARENWTKGSNGKIDNLIDYCIFIIKIN